MIKCPFIEPAPGEPENYSYSCFVIICSKRTYYLLELIRPNIQHNPSDSVNNRRYDVVPTAFKAIVTKHLIIVMYVSQISPRYLRNYLLLHDIDKKNNFKLFIASLNYCIYYKLYLYKSNQNFSSL